MPCCLCNENRNQCKSRIISNALHYDFGPMKSMIIVARPQLPPKHTFVVPSPERRLKFLQMAVYIGKPISENRFGCRLIGRVRPGPVMISAGRNHDVPLILPSWNPSLHIAAPEKFFEKRFGARVRAH